MPEWKRVASSLVCLLLICNLRWQRFSCPRPHVVVASAAAPPPANSRLASDRIPSVRVYAFGQRFGCFKKRETVRRTAAHDLQSARPQKSSLTRLISHCASILPTGTIAGRYGDVAASHRWAGSNIEWAPDLLHAGERPSGI